MSDFDFDRQLKRVLLAAAKLHPNAAKNAAKANRTKMRGYDEPDPRDAWEYVKRGGWYGHASLLAKRAAKRMRDDLRDELQHERRRWLKELREWLRDPSLSAIVRSNIEHDVKLLRKSLGLPQPVAERRAATRERVRKFRARQKAVSVAVDTLSR